MKLTKYIAAGTVLLMAVCAAGAQEDDFSSFDDDFSSDASDDFGSFGDDDDFSSFGDDDDFGSFDDFGGDDSSSGLPITFSGDLSLDARCYFAKNDSKRFINGISEFTSLKRGKIDANGNEVGVEDFTLAGIPRAKLGMDYSGTSADASLHLNLCEDTLMNHPIDIIDELILRGYFLDNHLVLEGGKMKVVWGKGDKLHVFDNFNSDNYSDFIIPDYIDRRVSTPMIRAVYSFEQPSLRVEGIFTPFLPVDQSVRLQLFQRGTQRFIGNGADVFLHLIKTDNAEFHQRIEYKHFILSLYQGHRIVKTGFFQPAVGNAILGHYTFLRDSIYL